MIATIVRIGVSAPRRVPGYLGALRKLQARSVAVVMYHGVTAEPSPVFNWTQLSLAKFEAQIELLADHYHVIPLAEAIDRLEQDRSLPDHAAVLTFDDGFRNVFTTALPVLERRGVPATCFLVSSLVGTRQPPWPDRLFWAVAHSRAESVMLDTEWPLKTSAVRAATSKTLRERLKALPNDEREETLETLLRALGPTPEITEESLAATLDWDEIEAMARTGLFTFGSHTHTHPILSRCSLERQREELTISRDILRERLGQADLFAFPNGTAADFTDDTKDLLREAGYRCGLATTEGLNRAGSDLYALRRVNVGADATLKDFELRMLGL